MELIRGTHKNIFCVSVSKARFKCRATAVLNSTDQIKFEFSTAVARRLKPSVV